jgi:hypothetical protein
VVKCLLGAAALYREGVHHTRLRRLGIEVRWSKINRFFESEDFTPPRLKKHVGILS